MFFVQTMTLAALQHLLLWLAAGAVIWRLQHLHDHGALQEATATTTQGDLNLIPKRGALWPAQKTALATAALLWLALILTEGPPGVGGLLLLGLALVTSGLAGGLTIVHFNENDTLRALAYAPLILMTVAMLRSVVGGDEIPHTWQLACYIGMALVVVIGLRLWFAIRTSASKAWTLLVSTLASGVWLKAFEILADPDDRGWAAAADLSVQMWLHLPEALLALTENLPAWAQQTFN